MTNILEKVAKSSGRFTPTDAREYLALQIARKLSDLGSVRHYAVLFEHHPEHLLLDIYRRCENKGQLSGEEFMKNLRALNE